VVQLITGGHLARTVDKLQKRHTWLAFPVAVAKKFSDDQASNLAALIAYFAFVSIFPLLLVFVTILELLFRGNPELRHRLLTSALGGFPGVGPELHGTAHPLSATGIALVVSLCVTLLGGLRVAAAAQNALNSAWLVPFTDRPRLPWSQLRNLGFVTVVGLGELATSLVSGGVEGMARHAFLARAGAVVVALGLNVLLFWGGFRLATSRVVSARDLWPGALAAGTAWQGLQLFGGFLLTHTLAKSSSLYGTFGLALGLLAWLYIQAQVTMIAIEIDVVRVRGLWPRSLDPPPLTEQDVTAYQLYAEAEQRRRGFKIEVDES
jgi:membrane protein